MAVMFEDVVSSNHGCSTFVCLPIFERQERLVSWMRNICGGVKTKDAPGSNRHAGGSLRTTNVCRFSLLQGNNSRKVKPETVASICSENVANWVKGPGSGKWK